MDVSNTKWVVKDVGGGSYKGTCSMTTSENATCNYSGQIVTYNGDTGPKFTVAPDSKGSTKPSADATLNEDYQHAILYVDGQEDPIVIEQPPPG